MPTTGAPGDAEDVAGTRRQRSTVCEPGGSTSVGSRPRRDVPRASAAGFVPAKVWNADLEGHTRACVTARMSSATRRTPEGRRRRRRRPLGSRDAGHTKTPRGLGANSTPRSRTEDEYAMLTSRACGAERLERRSHAPGGGSARGLVQLDPVTTELPARTCRKVAAQPRCAKPSGSRRMRPDVELELGPCAVVTIGYARDILS